MQRSQPKGLKVDFSHPSNYNSVYIPTFHDSSRFLHFFGSASSGKSYFVAQREIVFSFQAHRKGRKTMVIRKVATTLKDSVHSQLKMVINQWGLSDFFKITKSPLGIFNEATGVEFVFMGLDDPEKLKSVVPVDRIWVEEATEMVSPLDLEQLDSRVRGFPEAQIVLSYNPINAQHWINRDIHKKIELPGIGNFHRIFKTTYRDNEKLLAADPGIVDRMEAKKLRNENFYKVYALGEWGSTPEGLIYGDFITAPELPEVAAYGLDFGWTDPCALVATCVVDDLEGLHHKKRLIADELIFESQLSVDNLADRIDSLGVRKDIPIYADGSGKQHIAELQDRGYWVVEADRSPGSRAVNIDRVKSYQLAITANSKNALREVENYSWQTKPQSTDKFKDRKPADGDDHSMQAIEYAAQHYHVPMGTITLGSAVV